MHVSLFGALFDFAPTILAIPIWSQYVELLEHSLDFLSNVFNSAGVAIIVFTIIVKTLLLPLTVQSIRASKAMQELQPKIKALQKQYGKDRQRLSQETMKLYSQHRVNPVSGCLPMLIQIPIFFGLYRAIQQLSTGKGIPDVSIYWSEPFLWLPSLAEPDPYKILPILAGIFQFIQTKMMRPQNQEPITDPQQKMMNQMMTFMPLLVVIFGWNFDSGPVLYWVTQSVYSVVQQWFITGWGSLHDWIPGLWELPEHRRLGYRPPRDLDDVVVVSGEDGMVKQGGIMGWFQNKMHEAAEQQNKRQESAARRAGGTTSVDDVEVIDDEVEEQVAATERKAKTTSYQARVDAATKKPATMTPKKQTPRQPAKSTNTQRSTTAKSGGQNGTTPVVPRKSRPPKNKPSE